MTHHDLTHKTNAELLELAEKEKNIWAAFKLGANLFYGRDHILHTAIKDGIKTVTQAEVAIAREVERGLEMIHKTEQQGLRQARAWRRSMEHASRPKPETSVKAKNLAAE